MTKRELIIESLVWIVFFIISNVVMFFYLTEPYRSENQLLILLTTFLFSFFGIRKQYKRYRKHNPKPEATAYTFKTCPLCSCIMADFDKTTMTHTGERFEEAHASCARAKNDEPD